MVFSPLEKMVSGACLRGFFVSPFLILIIVYFTKIPEFIKVEPVKFMEKTRKKPKKQYFHTGFSEKIRRCISPVVGKAPGPHFSRSAGGIDFQMASDKIGRNEGEEARVECLDLAGVQPKNNMA